MNGGCRVHEACHIIIAVYNSIKCQLGKLSYKSFDDCDKPMALMPSQDINC